MTEIDQALAHHQAGRLQQAETMYRQILMSRPNHPDALHLLGMIALQAGNHDTAVKLIKRAVEVKPDISVYHHSLAQALRTSRKLDQAITAYRQAIALNLDLVEAHNDLGTALQEQGELSEAIVAFRNTVALAPNFVEARYNLGNALHEAGELVEAVASYQQVLENKRDDVDAWNNLGLALKDQGELAAAIDAFKQAQTLRPDDASININLGLALDKDRQFADAVLAYRRALGVKPDDTKTQIRLGKTLYRESRLQEAINSFRQAITHSPKNAKAHGNLAKALMALGKGEKAVDSFREALRHDPDLLAARLGLVSVLRFVNLPGYEHDLEAELKKCLSCPEVDLQDLARPIANQVKRKYALQPPPASVTDLRALATAWQSDELLLALLLKMVNVDAGLELWLTQVRRWLFFEYLEAEQIPDAVKTLMAAFGQQCFSNEYVFNEAADESKSLEHLIASCEQLAESNDWRRLENLLLPLAMYRSIFVLAWGERLRAVDIEAWSPCTRALVQTVLIEPLQEIAIAKNIPSFGDIKDTTSQVVRRQYEDHPYPRWLSLPSAKKIRLPNFLSRAFHFQAPDFLYDATEVLVAGCGTGREPLSLAVGCEDLNILAVDLSRHSLAYASRMADELEINNVRFAQRDILELPQLDRRFHVIECGGVLHHMADPITGWGVLTQLLVPGGIMRIGLYSEHARRAVVMARKWIRQRELPADSQSIRVFREHILAGAAEDQLADLKDSDDFYTLSACRDLLFHVQEHRFTLPDISKALDDLGLEFIGFDLPRPDMKKRYWELFPEDRRMTDLQAWDRFEQHYPSVFAGMYVFWCQKRMCA